MNIINSTVIQRYVLTYLTVNTKISEVICLRQKDCWKILKN